MDPFSFQTVSLGLLTGTVLAARAIHKQSLTLAGSLAGFCVGSILICTGLRGFNLVVFYQLASWATKYKQPYKLQKDATLESSSVRGASQVLAVSILAMLLSVYHALVYGNERPLSNNDNASKVACAVIAHHATSLADTLASELGILQNAQQPVLITQPWRKVPPGCNGGVTLTGLVWSLVGGLGIGSSTILLDWCSGLPVQSYAIPLLLYSSLAGWLGSVLDSLLGATVQATYYDGSRVHHAPSEKATRLTGYNLLSNEQVNFCSTLLTMYFCGWVVSPLLFG